jgi:DNA topoisomerase-1
MHAHTHTHIHTYIHTCRVYKSRAKNAQEAHEAIRPTNPSLTPDSLPSHLSSDQTKLYRLIWERTLASQMCNAVIEQVRG